MRRWTVLLVSLAGFTAGGCGAQGILLGTTGGKLFTTMDALALPGEEVALQAKLQGGDFLRARPGYVVRFSRDGQLFKAAETDGDGVASVSFTPAAAGDYIFTAEVSPAGQDEEVPAARMLRVTCRDANTPIAVVDLDKTVVASGFHTVLVGTPDEMPDSPRVMHRIAKDRTVVYLTHRPDYFGPKSKGWLKDKGFPPGPVLLSTVEGFLQGSGEYKTAAIKQLQDRFKGIEIGIGDKASDVAAYHANGLKGFLIIQIPTGDDPKPYTELADDIDELPPAVQVVTGWDQVEKALFSGASYPPAETEKRLRALAAERTKPAEK